MKVRELITVCLHIPSAIVALGMWLISLELAGLWVLEIVETLNIQLGLSFIYSLISLMRIIMYESNADTVESRPEVNEVTFAHTC